MSFSQMNLKDAVEAAIKIILDRFLSIVDLDGMIPSFDFNRLLVKKLATRPRSKKLKIFAVSNVADMTITFKSSLLGRVHLISPKRISEFNPLSCASSMTKNLYRLRSGSSDISLRRTPSVMNLILVYSFSALSNRISYPQVYPTSVASSLDTLWHKVTAAILLGCVTPMIPSVESNSSKMYCGTCVVLPHPVSPEINTTCEFLI